MEYTKRDAARALGIDYKTLDDWLHKAGIADDQLGRDPNNSALRFVPADVILLLAARHGRPIHLPGVTGGPVAPMPFLELLSQRLDAVEERVGVLEGFQLPPAPGEWHAMTLEIEAAEGVALRAFAERHGIPISTARHHELTGKIATIKRGIPNRDSVAHILTTPQQEAAVAFWRATMPSFTTCGVSGCPCGANE